ncbi:MAG: alkaline phosphatase family protein [Candidatus Cybelea sp.]
MAVRPATGNRASSTYISHVVVIIQENRSFENFFAGFPGANAPTEGYAFNHHHIRVKVNLHQTTFETNPNLPHDWKGAISDYDGGNMDGFHTGPGSNYAAYAYIDRTQITPYWDMAEQYVLADAMYPTEFGGSFTGHLTAVSGTDNINKTEAQVNYPTAGPNDCDAPPGTKSSLVQEYPYRQVGLGNGPFPCFNQWRVLPEVLDAHNVSWKFYVDRLLDAGIWSPFEASRYVRYGPDWNKDMVAPQSRVLKDIAHGKLAAVSWVTPSKDDSDHPEAHDDLGPSWVASIVNAVGTSPYWDSTAIVVIWDDWGGFYDNAMPPQLDFRGLGIRVPCLIISPYAKMGSGSGGYVSHTQYEFGSIVKFIEEVFDLPVLGVPSKGYTDTRATSIMDSFDFTQSPRKFKKFGSKYPASRFINEQPPASDEPDDE